jgi:hypothetical protein
MHHPSYAQHPHRPYSPALSISSFSFSAFISAPALNSSAVMLSIYPSIHMHALLAIRIVLSLFCIAFRSRASLTSFSAVTVLD